MASVSQSLSGIPSNYYRDVSLNAVQSSLEQHALNEKVAGQWRKLSFTENAQEMLQELGDRQMIQLPQQGWVFQGKSGLEGGLDITTTGIQINLQGEIQAAMIEQSALVNELWLVIWKTSEAGSEKQFHSVGVSLGQSSGPIQQTMEFCPVDLEEGAEQGSGVVVRTHLYSQPAMGPTKFPREELGKRVGDWIVGPTNEAPIEDLDGSFVHLNLGSQPSLYSADTYLPMTGFGGEWPWNPRSSSANTSPTSLLSTFSPKRRPPVDQGTSPFHLPPIGSHRTVRSAGMDDSDYVFPDLQSEEEAIASGKQKLEEFVKAYQQTVYSGIEPFRARCQGASDQFQRAHEDYRNDPENFQKLQQAVYARASFEKRYRMIEEQLAALSAEMKEVIHDRVKDFRLSDRDCGLLIQRLEKLSTPESMSEKCKFPEWLFSIDTSRLSAPSVEQFGVLLCANQNFREGVLKPLFAKFASENNWWVYLYKTSSKHSNPSKIKENRQLIDDQLGPLQNSVVQYCTQRGIPLSESDMRYAARKIYDDLNNLYGLFPTPKGVA